MVVLLRSSRLELVGSSRLVLVLISSSRLLVVLVGSSRLVVVLVGTVGYGSASRQ